MSILGKPARIALLSVVVLLSGCGASRFESFIEGLERRQHTACVEVHGAMQASGGLAGGSVAVKAIAATGGVDMEVCREVLR